MHFKLALALKFGEIIDEKHAANKKLYFYVPLENVNCQVAVRKIFEFFSNSIFKCFFFFFLKQQIIFDSFFFMIAPSFHWNF